MKNGDMKTADTSRALETTDRAKMVQAKSNPSSKNLLYSRADVNNLDGQPGPQA